MTTDIHTMDLNQMGSSVHLPRVEIRFCVKCKWNLRAAYYAQELLQTFCSPPSAITLGEIALVPVEGGIFTITLYHPMTPSLPAESSRGINDEHSAAESLTRQDNDSDAISSTQNHSPRTAGGGPTAIPETQRDTTTATTTHGLSMQRIQMTQIWDRKTDGGFPETKDLKDRIRNVVDPGRRMGHIDRSLDKSKKVDETKAPAAAGEEKKEGKVEEQEDCEDCRIDARERLEDEIGRVTSQ